MSQFLGIQVSAEANRAAAGGSVAAHEEIYRACGRPVYTLIRRLIDVQLSYAPDAGLSEAQAYRLWRERVDLMDSLVKVRYAESSHLAF